MRARRQARAIHRVALNMGLSFERGPEASGTALVSGDLDNVKAHAPAGGCYSAGVVKAVTVLKRKSGMSVEEFQGYWRGRHPEVVVRLPGLRRYVQSHTRLAGYRKSEPIYDGIAEVWFDDGQAVHALGGTPEMAAVEADEARFIDRSTVRVILTDEHLVKDDPVPPGAAKNIEFVTRKPGLAVPDFQRYWREIHGPLGAKLPMIRRYGPS